MEMELKEIIELSRLYGKDKEYVIAGGGNTSYKNDQFIWVKASGFALATIDEKSFVCLSREKLEVINNKEYSSNALEREEEVKNDLMASIVSDNDSRPSVESSLHNIIHYPLVVHTHPTLGNSLLCSQNAEKYCKDLFGDDALYIEYTDPGYILFKKVARELENFRNKKGYDPKMIMLENHGIFVSGNSGKEITDTYEHIEKQIKKCLQQELPDIQIRNIDSSISSSLLFLYPEKDALFSKSVTSDLILDFVKNEASFKSIATAFTPDHIVYCKSHYIIIDETNEEDVEQMISNYADNYGYYPKVIAIKGKGLLIIDDNKNAADIVIDLITNMMKISFYARSFGISKPLTPEQISFIENWEAENYRKKISK
ncbi:MAG: class II aldolase [Bacteroidales bacterium]|nr:class II aldolase [Bacteroidales bacterium]